MPYETRFTQSVSDKVSTLHPDIKKLLRLAITEISVKPSIGKNLPEELFRFQSYRFKGYRITYHVNDIDKIIIIYMFGHRRDVYEVFSELVKNNK